jgi:major type 1 subunit fimbrin (pilin)
MFQKMVKCTVLCTSSLLILMAAATAKAADGEVEFTGKIVDSPCTIQSESVNKAVDMGQVRTSDFANTLGSNAGSTPFSLTLENCNIATLKNASIQFSGQESATDSTVLGMVGDQQVAGVGIQINDARTGKKLALNTASTDYKLRPLSNTFDFTAAYVRLIVDTEAVGETPAVVGIGTGKVNALASFDITYK